MQTTRSKLWRAQAEVQRAAHNQDLIQVPKRALLDREAEGIILPTGGAEAHGEINEDSVFDPASAQR
ncbi:MAG: hypothetical protein WBE38_14610 [Terracidiphilus sp.]|jgi:hypothetical protein